MKRTSTHEYPFLFLTESTKQTTTIKHKKSFISVTALLSSVVILCDSFVLDLSNFDLLKVVLVNGIFFGTKFVTFNLLFDLTRVVDIGALFFLVSFLCICYKNYNGN